MSFPLRLPANKPLITVTHPKPSVWIIELHNGQDSRLTQTLVKDGLMPALDAVERSWRERWRAAQAASDENGGGGALIFVGRRDQDKFFSNGLDYLAIRDDKAFFPETFNPFLVRVLEFPLPIIAAINGHCFAGGMMLALTCDYRVLTDGKKRNVWLCMNEIHFGSTWPLSFAAILRAKIGDMRLYRKIAFEGHRFPPQEALETGLVDALVSGGTQAVLEKAMEVAEAKAPLAKTGVFGLVKREIYYEALEMTRKYWEGTNAFIEDKAAKARL